MIREDEVGNDACPMSTGVSLLLKQYPPWRIRFRHTFSVRYRGGSASGAYTGSHKYVPLQMGTDGSDRAILIILQSLLGEAKRENANCLSPARRDEFLHFSGASLQKAQQWSNRRERRRAPSDQS
jgi:hypothetical protein